MTLPEVYILLDIESGICEDNQVKSHITKRPNLNIEKQKDKNEFLLGSNQTAAAAKIQGP